MLKNKLADKINQQLNFEFFSANIYLQMSAWAETNKFAGAAVYLKKQAQEEMGHMLKIFDYLNQKGVMAQIGKIDAPSTEFKSIHELFKDILAHEKIVTKRINDLSQQAWADKDLTTFNFLQWFVTEQHEEETQFQSILDKFDLVGTDKRGLFMIDQELAQMAAARVEEI